MKIKVLKVLKRIKFNKNKRFIKTNNSKIKLTYNSKTIKKVNNKNKMVVLKSFQVLLNILKLMVIFYQNIIRSFI
jgi:hypothetical protein